LTGARDFIFSKTIQTNSVAHPACSSFSIGGSFLGLKQLKCEVYHLPPSSSAEVVVSGAITRLLLYPFMTPTGRASPSVLVQKVHTFEHLYNNECVVTLLCVQVYVWARIPVLGPAQPPIQWVPGLSPRVKRLGHGVDHPPPSSDETQERVELYSPSGPLWPVVG